MPNDTSNFTQPDNPNPNPTNAVGGPGATGGGPYKVQTEWGEKWWDPNADGGAGRWITDPATDGGEDLNRTQQQYGDRVARGNAGPVRTYNAGEEANRYNDMSKAKFGTGPAIDMTRPDETRGIGMDALSMLQNRAQGGMTPAQALATQQRMGAVAGINAGAASIKGGAMARAAAARGAQATTARVDAQGQQDQAALRAREMADAQGQYFGAAHGQRGRDLGVATSQADLDAKQLEANEQRDQFYQGLRYDTKKSAVDDALGRDDAAANAANAARTQAASEDAARTGRIKDVASAGVGGVAGGLDAANKAQQSGPSQKSDDPWDPKNYSSSDPKTKTAVHRVTELEARRLKNQGQAMIEKTKAHAAAPSSVGDAPGKPVDEYDGKYLGSPFPSAAKASKEPAPQSLDEAMANSFDGADPYKTPPAAKGLLGAPKGYAASRNGQMGSMFGTAERPSYDLGSGYSDDPSKNYSSASPVRPENEWAPGSADFYAGSHSRDLVTSDPAAKREAFFAGMNHASDAAETGHFGAVPDYAKTAPARNESTREQPRHENSYPAASRNFERADRAPQHQANGEAEEVYRRANEAKLSPFGIGGALGGGIADANEDDVQAARSNNKTFVRAEAPPQPGERPMAPPPGEAPSGWQDLVGRARAMMSDPKTKEDIHHFGGPMAAANRSMDPSSYEYKPEYLPPEQKPGEKNIGPMADKMEADPVASTAIVKDPNTGLLAIDKTKGLKLVMGGLASLQRQVDHMEGSRR